MNSNSFNLAQRFYAIAELHGNKAAIRIAQNQVVSYARLNEQSNQLARFFSKKGIRYGDVIAIFNNKSVLGYASMLACLKIGAIYVNLDVTSPTNRIKKILDKAQPKLILNDFEDHLPIQELIVSYVDYVVALQKLKEKIANFAVTNLEYSPKLTGSTPAYIMFTSGSTGFPKGAVMSHSNVSNFIEWAIVRFQVTSKDVFTNVNPIYFDNSVFDFYVALFSGATLVPINITVSVSPRLLLDKVNNLGCTVWFSVPSMLVYLLSIKILNKEDFRTIRTIIFGGEGFPKPKLKQLYSLFNERVELVNVYGPTECTCICSAYTISEKDFEDMLILAPLGYLTSNFSYEIIPIENEKPNFGELCLKGPNVGLGYYNDASLTKERFIQNPFNASFTELVYKTGDLVDKDSIGQLHFKGRTDNQIKHMGYRIELEEIEAALNTLRYVNEVAVLYKRLGQGLGQIVAFVNISEDKELKDILLAVKSILPPYMLPKRIKTLELLPKNKNGKIDKVQLKNKYL